jgi:regulator of protease activity HflC (stomatin/prohibitin superfamily)
MGRERRRMEVQMLERITGNRTTQSGFGRRGLMLLAIVLLTLTAFNSIACVKTGHVGVVTVFGRVTGRTMGEGIHFVNPLARVHELTIKTLEAKERASVPSQEGLIMGLEASVLYHLQPERAAEVFQKVGTGYAEVLLIPNFRSAIRGVTAGNLASTLYSDARESIARQIMSDLQAEVQPRGIVVENVLLRDLQLPETLKQAIEAKQQAQQEAQRMEFVLQRERQEAERKRVEAQGIKDFQNVVTEGISDKLLEWKGIEATVELARSANAKVVVVGGTKGGLPLIFSAEK